MPGSFASVSYVGRGVSPPERANETEPCRAIASRKARAIRVAASCVTAFRSGTATSCPGTTLVVMRGPFVRSRADEPVLGELSCECNRFHQRRVVHRTMQRVHEERGSLVVPEPNALLRR